jgi:hypothetical protein
VEVVPVGLGQVYLPRSDSRLQDRGDEDIGPEEELRVCDLIDVGIGV